MRHGDISSNAEIQTRASSSEIIIPQQNLFPHEAMLEYAVRFPHSRLEPVCLRVVLHGASVAVAVVHQVRRACEDEIDAVRRHLAHLLDTVAVKDCVDWKLLLNGVRVHDVTPFCVVSR